MEPAVMTARRRRRRSLAARVTEADGRRVISPLLLSHTLPPLHLGSTTLLDPTSSQRAEPDRMPPGARCQELGVITLPGPISGSRMHAATHRIQNGSRRWLRRRPHQDRPCGFHEHAHAFAEVVFFDVQRGNETHDLVVEPAGDKKDVALESRPDRGLGDGLVVALGGDHRAELTALAEARMRAQPRGLLA